MKKRRPRETDLTLVHDASGRSCWEDPNEALASSHTLIQVRLLPGESQPCPERAVRCPSQRGAEARWPSTGPTPKQSPALREGESGEDRAVQCGLPQGPPAVAPGPRWAPAGRRLLLLLRGGHRLLGIIQLQAGYK